MIPDEHQFAFSYPEYDIDTQVSMQIRLAKAYARDYYDAGLSANELIDEVRWCLKRDLKDLELNEKYEYCLLYKDTIENIKYIPIHKLF